MPDMKSLPSWAEDLRRRYVRGEASVFVLHGNVYDAVLSGEETLSLTDFLGNVLLRDSKDTVVVYNVATGVRFLKRGKGVGNLEDLLLESDKTKALAAIERLLIGTTKTAVILEYAEALAPAGDTNFQSEADRAAVVTLHRWSFLPEIEHTDNVVILISENLTDVASKLISNPKVAVVEVPMPDRATRREAALAADAQLSPKEADRYAEITAGLKAIQIMAILTPAPRSESEAAEREAFITGLLGGVDAKEQQPVVEQAAAQGIKLVGWHAGPTVGAIEGIPQVAYNVSTDPLEVAKAAGLYAVVDSGGKAGVILFTDSIYAIATAKTNAEKAAIESACPGCKVLSIEDTPIGDLANRMPQLTTSLLAKYGKAWTYSIAVNDLYFDFSAPSLTSAGIDPASGYPRQISAGDGSVPAFQRIRDKQYQIATVAEPLNLQGWQLIDELNRAFAGEKASGYVPPVHLFTPANIDKDGGDKNIFDPGNGYRDQYKKIWGVK